MRVKLAAIAVSLACFGGIGMFTTMTTTATAASPDLCETRCGESWGAREHARAFAEERSWTKVSVYECAHNSEYGAQWVCLGSGTWVGDGAVPVEWEAWISAYGYLKHFQNIY